MNNAMAIEMIFQSIDSLYSISTCALVLPALTAGRLLAG